MTTQRTQLLAAMKAYKSYTPDQRAKDLTKESDPATTLRSIAHASSLDFGCDIHLGGRRSYYLPGLQDKPKVVLPVPLPGNPAWAIIPGTLHMYRRIACAMHPMYTDAAKSKQMVQELHTVHAIQAATRTDWVSAKQYIAQSREALDAQATPKSYYTLTAAVQAIGLGVGVRHLPPDVANAAADFFKQYGYIRGPTNYNAGMLYNIAEHLKAANEAWKRANPPPPASGDGCIQTLVALVMGVEAFSDMEEDFNAMGAVSQQTERTKGLEADILARAQACSGLTAAVRNSLLTRANQHLAGGLTSGELDMRRLPQLAQDSGDSKVFARRELTIVVNTALTILLDCSGSMFPHRISTAQAACLAMAQTALAISGTDVEVIGFGSGLKTMLPFGSRDTSKLKECWDLGGTDTSDALRNGVARNLTRRQCTRHVVLVLTDGGSNDHTACQETCAAAVSMGVEVHALGIDMDVERLDYDFPASCTKTALSTDRLRTDILKLLLGVLHKSAVKKMG